MKVRTDILDYMCALFKCSLDPNAEMADPATDDQNFYIQ